MADCKDIDAALAQLSSKIDGFGNKLNDLNNRLNDLDRKQKECCDKKERKPPETNLEALIKRIAKLEDTQEALKIGIVEILNNFAHIGSINTDFALAFDGLYELINPVIESVSSIIEFLKG